MPIFGQCNGGRRPGGPIRPGGFTLTELLVVLGIMGLLMALSLPAIRAMLGTYNLDAAGQAVSGQLNFARQNALASNHLVQVRFYQIADYDGSANKVIRAMQFFLENDTGITPVGKPYFFPPTVKILTNMVNGTDASSLVDTANAGIMNVIGGDPNNPLPPPYGKSDYVFFRIRADGRIDPASGGNAWTNASLTLALETAPLQANGLPANYITIQINSLSGVARTYRP